MKLRVQPFAFASAISSASMYTLISFLIGSFPREAVGVAVPAIHLSRLKLLKYLRPFFAVQPVNIAIGAFEVALYSYIAALIVALLYNLFTKKDA